MSISPEERERRRVLSELLVDLLRPTNGDVGTTATQRLVAYCVGVSTFGPHRMGLNKLAETAGLPRSTVRSTLTELCRKGWVEKLPDKTYVISEQFMGEAFASIGLEKKYRLILEAAQRMMQLWPL